MSEHIKIGEYGEKIAQEYLENKGYTILARNFHKKWGEIDIICSVPRGTTKLGNNVPRGTLEAGKNKNVPRRTFLSWLESLIKKSDSFGKYSVPRGTYKPHNVPRPPAPRLRRAGGTNDDKIVFVEVKTTRSRSIRPEDNVTYAKQKKLIRTCRMYLEENRYSQDIDWQIDVIAILLDSRTNKAIITHIEQAVYF